MNTTLTIDIIKTEMPNSQNMAPDVKKFETLESIVKLIPAIAKGKYLLFKIDIPPVKPNTKPISPKIPVIKSR